MSFKKGIINSLSLLLFAVICAYFAWSTRSAINSLSDIAIHLRYDNRTSLPLPGLTICYDGANLTFSCKYNATVLNNTGTNADCYITKYMLATIPNVPAGLTDNFDRCYVLDPALAPNLTRGMMAPLALIETPFQMSTAIQYTSSFAIWAPGTSFVDSLYLLVPMWNSNINFQRRYVTYSYSEHQTIDKSIRTSLQYRTEFFPNDVKEDVFGFVVVPDHDIELAYDRHYILSGRRLDCAGSRRVPSNQCIRHLKFHRRAALLAFIRVRYHYR
ncbi:hypothetical protein BC936DRAFT_137708 [Jimgerdemannia flammicorona]|uniref:Uncharacterized protein n=1 Tax=Jimgerdemannia flammicorona TaxID=994334 RepID=A0A433CWU3_9FUNG|nr:hypothetical protein BC936DRAFT_137708 [Jimgerdemannia flammicorona]